MTFAQYAMIEIILACVQYDTMVRDYATAGRQIAPARGQVDVLTNT